MEETLLITRFSNTKETCKWLFTIRFKSGFNRKFTNAGVMYGLLTFVMDFTVDFITDFYFVKVSYKVSNKVGNKSQQPIHDSSIK